MFYPKPMYIKIGNLVTVEVLGKDGKHRMYRSFIVPMTTKGSYRTLDEVLNWIKNGKKIILANQPLTPLETSYRRLAMI